MKSMCVCSVLACSTLATPALIAQDHSAHAGHQDKAAAATAPEPAHKAAPEALTWTMPYTLDTCPVSGEALGSMGDPIVKVYDGREVRLCCAGCSGKFEADKAGYFAKIDAKIIADQMRYYPEQTCLVTDEALEQDGEDIAVNMVYGNRLVRFCCKMCKSDFKADPAAYIAKLDAAAAGAQRENYPLATCPVSGGELGSMGDPMEVVVAGRLVKLCCAGCVDKLKANPAEYLAQIDAAWQAAGMYLPAAAAGLDDDGGHGDHADDDAEAEHGDEGHGDHGDHDHGG